MKIIIRADASVTIGTGHIMRCLTLALRLRETGAEVAFICRKHPGNLCSYIENLGFKVFELPTFNSTWDEDGVPHLEHADWLGSSQRYDALVSQLAVENVGLVDWIIVDHYALDWRWEGLLRANTKKIMVIDDIADRTHDCDILLDQNLCSNTKVRYRDLVPKTCRQLLGPCYALLRKEFGLARDKLRTNRDALNRDGKINKILVFMGGGDAENATSLILDVLQLLNRSDLLIDVVLGSANPHAQTIMQRCKNIPNVSCYIQTPNFAELMLGADFAIGAGGATSWERCALGLPSLTISIASNQTAIAIEAANKGVSFFAGELKTIDKYQLVETLEKIFKDDAALRSMSQRALALVDSQGTDRVVQEVLKVSSSI